MIKRFFFYRVNMLSDDFPIGMGIKDTAPVLSDTADAELPFVDDTMVITEKAVHLVVFQFLVEKGFLQHDSSFLWAETCPA
jgi:hypothetical protein